MAVVHAVARKLSGHETQMPWVETEVPGTRVVLDTMWRLADAIRATPRLFVCHVAYLLALADLMASLHEQGGWELIHDHANYVHGRAAVTAWDDFRTELRMLLEGEAAAMEQVLSTASTTLPLSRLHWSIPALQLHITALAQAVRAVHRDLSMAVFLCCCKLGCIAAVLTLGSKAIGKFGLHGSVAAAAWACPVVFYLVGTALCLICATLGKRHDYKQLMLRLVYAQRVLERVRQRAPPPEAARLTELLLRNER